MQKQVTAMATTIERLHRHSISPVTSNVHIKYIYIHIYTEYEFASALFVVLNFLCLIQWLFLRVHSNFVVILKKIESFQFNSYSFSQCSFDNSKFDIYAVIIYIYIYLSFVSLMAFLQGCKCMRLSHCVCGRAKKERTIRYTRCDNVCV